MAVIGSVIDGKYEILKLIGKGGMSEERRLPGLSKHGNDPAAERLEASYWR